MPKRFRISRQRGANSREVEVDLMEKVEDLTILCKIRANLNERMKIKARPCKTVVIPTKVVLVHT